MMSHMGKLNQRKDCPKLHSQLLEDLMSKKTGGKKVFCHVEKIMSQSQDMGLNVNFIHAFNKSTMI